MASRQEGSPRGRGARKRWAFFPLRRDVTLVQGLERASHTEGGKLRPSLLLMANTPCGAVRECVGSVRNVPYLLLYFKSFWQPHRFRLNSESWNLLKHKINVSFLLFQPLFSYVKPWKLVWILIKVDGVSKYQRQWWKQVRISFYKAWPSLMFLCFITSYGNTITIHFLFVCNRMTLVPGPFFDQWIENCSLIFLTCMFISEDSWRNCKLIWLP